MDSSRFEHDLASSKCIPGVVQASRVDKERNVGIVLGTAVAHKMWGLLKVYMEGHWVEGVKESDEAADN